MSRRLAVVALLGCWGCAFTLDGPDPNRPRNSVPKCDTSKGLVALDGVMASALAITALSVASDSNEPAVALLPVAVASLYLAGAVRGNSNVNECRKAMDEYSHDYGDEELADNGPTFEDDEDGDGNDRPRKKKTLLPHSKPVYAGQQQPYGPTPPYTAPGGPPYQTPYPPPQPVQPPVYPGQQPPPQQPPQAPQQPAAQPPAQQPARPAKAKPAPEPEPEGDEWSDFWREVP